MNPKRGGFALVYFPHSDLTTIKLRPVLVVQADDLGTGLGQLIVAMVSSNLTRAGHQAALPFDWRAPFRAAQASRPIP